MPVDRLSFKVCEVGAPPHGNADQDHLREIGELVARLADRYGVSAGVIRVHAETVYAKYGEVPIRAFIPVLVEKELREWLRHGQGAAQ